MTGPSAWVDIRAIEVEAAAWIAQLESESFSEADRAALREWCRRSPAHREALRRLSAIWVELDSLSALPGRLPAAPPNPPAHARLRWRPFWAAHAAALAVAVIGLAVWVGHGAWSTARVSPVALYRTSFGEQTTVVLADKSTIRLNTDTLLEVDYRPQERRIRLVKGEALFDVAKDHARPFIVYAAADTIRAVGTRFSVRLLEGNVEVVVSEGKVALTRSIGNTASGTATRRASVIRQQQTAIIDDRAADPIEVVTVDGRELERRLSWASGVLEFNGESLEKVVAGVSRYTPLRIRIAQPELGQMPVGGRFRVGETQALFDVVKAGFGARVIYDDDGVLITRD